MHMMKVKLATARGLIRYEGRMPGKRIDKSMEQFPNQRTLHPERTADNYALLFSEPKGGKPTFRREKPNVGAAVCERALDAAVDMHTKTTGKKPRKDAVGLANWVVTLPKGVPEAQAPWFFACMLAFFYSVYGVDAVVGGFVHMDQTTPHMHVPVIMTKDGRLQAKNIMSYKHMATIHDDAEEFAKKHKFSGVRLSEDDVLGRAMSNLSREELNALKAHISVTVDEKTADRVEELEKEKQALKTRQGAFEGQVLSAEGLSDWNIAEQRTRASADRLQAKIDEAAARVDSDFVIRMSDTFEQGGY